MNTQKILLKFEPEKENLLPAIKAIAEENKFLTSTTINQIARYFRMSPAAVFSTASFYDQIKLTKPADLIIEICDGANCVTKGAEKVIKEVEKFFGQRVGDDNNPAVKIERISCLGKCLAGPIMVVNGNVFEKVLPEKVDEILRGYWGRGS